MYRGGELSRQVRRHVDFVSIRQNQAGQRLDENAAGFGFGLSITRELTELYAGSFTLDRSPMGGVRVTIHLPSAGVYRSI